MAGINAINMNNFAAYSNYKNASSLFNIGGTGQTNAIGALGSLNALKTREANNFLSSFQNQASSPLSFLTSMKQNASEFNSSVKALTGFGANGVFSQQGANSSDTDALTVNSQNKNSRFNNFSPMSVEIGQVATTQRNEGASMLSSGRNAERGEYGFSIDVGGQSHDFSIKVGAGDTNKSIQQKMADAVNKRGIGINATVEQGDNARSSRLVFESEDTGTNEAFAVRDTKAPNGLSGLASMMNVDEADQAAQNAEYSVNGEQRTSQSNEVELGRGVRGTLKEATDDAVRVSYGQDQEAIRGGVEDFVKNYNSMLDSADRSSMPRLSSALNGITNTYGGTLSNLGIESDESGRLSINSDKLDASIQNGRLEDAFRSGGSYGIGGRLQNTANSLERNPMSYSNTSALMTTYNRNNMFNFNNQASMFSGQLFNFLL